MSCVVRQFNLLSTILVLALFGDTAIAQDFYVPGFQQKLKTNDAKKGYSNASLLGTFSFLQVGSKYITAVNSASGTERWRFESKSSAIRRMHNQRTFLLVEAEDLIALDPGTGQKKWEVPLNCHSVQNCNTRVRSIDPQAIVLSGFDKRDDNLMLVDAQTGQRQWPSWVVVPNARHLVYTPTTIVVATGDAPYAVIGLDRYTGRKRWSFRPGGTDKPASGLYTSGKMVVTWWEGQLTNEVYSISLESGKQVANWPVTKRARQRNDIIGAGPGFFYNYQPSHFGAGGAFKVWNSATGELIRRTRHKNLVGPPIVRGNLMYLWSKAGSSLLLQVVGVLDGKSRWSYRRLSEDHDTIFHGAYMVIRFLGKKPALITLNTLTGKIVAAGAIVDKTYLSGGISYADKRVFLMNGPNLVRYEPEKSGTLLVRFNQYVSNGQVKEAEELHALVRPFVDEVPAAAKIHRRLVGQSYKVMANRMQSGGLAALFPGLIRLSSDQKMQYFEDFRSFMFHVEQQLASHDMNSKITRGDQKRVVTLGRRLVETLRRFQHKLTGGSDQEFTKINRSVFLKLNQLLVRNRRINDGLQLLQDLWNMPWCTRGPELRKMISGLVLPNLKRLIPALATAVNRGTDQDAAILSILEIPGLHMVVRNVPKIDDIPSMTPADYSAHLARFRAAVAQP